MHAMRELFGGPPRVLVVDDVEHNRELLKRRLVTFGCDATLAESGSRAIELIQSQTFDLVLLDIMMANVDGLETLHFIRQEFSPAELPVLMVTARDDTETVVSALEQGANDYVVKPFDFAVLKARMRAHLERKAAKAALKALNHSLEQKVEQRTEAIRLQNELMFEEIAQRKAVEQALREQTMRAEAASRTKSNFLSQMSHELRTPLNGIIGYGELILAAPHDPVKYQGCIRDIVQSGHQLLGMINDILELANVEEGPTPLNERDVDVATLLDDCCEVVVPIAEANGIQLERRFQASAKLSGDACQLRRAIVHLISNAVKFSESGMTVTIDAEISDAGTFDIVVRDMGVGISEDKLERVLEPFQQADTGLDRKYEGAGLGLPIAKMLVERHGGALRVHSKPDAGTTVSLCLPMDRLRTHTLNAA